MTEQDLAKSYLEKEYSDASKPASKVAQQPITKDEPRARRFGCKFYGCGCLVLLLILCFGIAFGTVFVFANRPPLLWEPLKQLINQKLQPATVATKGELNSQAILAKLEQQIVNGGKLKLTEKEFASLVAERIGRKVGVDFVAGSGRIFIDLDPESINPLWVFVEVGMGTGTKIQVTKIGTGLITAPEDLNNTLTALIENLVLGSDSPIQTMLNNGAQIKGISFTDETVELELSLADLIPLL